MNYLTSDFSLITEMSLALFIMIIAALIPSEYINLITG